MTATSSRLPAMRARSPQAAAALIACVAACSSSSDGEHGGSDAAQDAGIIAAATFERIHADVLAPKCAIEICHGAARAGDLPMLEPDAAHRALVGMPASPDSVCGDSGLQRVEPRHPERSLLVLKLDRPLTPCGEPMPLGGVLSPAALESIRAWIAAGAPR